MIQVFKMVSGEEMIATIAGEASDHYVLEDAVTLIYQNMQDGRMSAGFAPFMPYAEGEIKLLKTSVACVADVKEQMVQEYTRIFSKIMVAPATALSGLSRG